MSVKLTEALEEGWLNFLKKENERHYKAIDKNNKVIKELEKRLEGNLDR